MKIEKLVGKKLVLFTKNNFRFQGTLVEYDGKFLEIFDEIKMKTKNINVDEVAEYELSN